MRRLIVTEFTSLNGVMEAPGGEAGHPHSGWTFKSIYGEDHYAEKLAELEGVDVLLLGRRTYEGFAEAWPEREGEFADRFNTIRKVVVSTTLTDPAWNNTTVVRSVDDVAALKAQDGGPIMVQGSATLVHALTGAGLVDEFRVMVHPVLVAGGLRTFPDPAEMQKLRLVDVRAYESGVALLVYERAGA